MRRDHVGSAGIRLLVAASFLASAAGAEALPKRKDKWLRLQTANLTIFSNAKDKTSRRLATDLETLRSTLAALFRLELNAPHPTYVFVFKNDGSFKPYKPLYKGKPAEVAGYFFDGGHATYMVINAESGRDPAQTIYHEYIHYVVRNNVPHLPLWFNEGLAEFFSTFEQHKNELRVGLPVANHVLWLRGHSMILNHDLFAMSRGSKDYNEGVRRGVFYAQSWALVHYLVARDPESRSRIPDFFAAVEQGLPGNDAFQQAFGVTDLRGLQHELHAYLQRSVMPYWRIELDEQPEGTEVEARRMDWHEVLYRLGDLLASRRQQRDEAADHFKAALEANPKHGPSIAGLGRLADLDERTDEALQLYEKAATLAPADYLVQYRYGLSLRKEHGSTHQARARAAFARAAKLRPEFGEAWAEWGGTYRDEEDPPDAVVEVLRRAHQLLPARAGILYDLGRVHESRGELEPALAIYDRAIGLDPEHQWSFACRGRVLRNLERYDEALVSLEEALRLDPGYTFALTQRGLVHSDAGRWDEAGAAFDAAIESDPENPWAHGNKGRALRNLERFDEALAALAEAVRLNPTYTWALHERGRVYSDQADHEKAVSAFDEAIQSDPSYKWSYASKSQALRRIGRFDEALLAVDESLRLDPNYEWAIEERKLVVDWADEDRYVEGYGHALELVKRGEYEAAERVLRELIESLEDPERIADAREFLNDLTALVK